MNKIAYRPFSLFVVTISLALLTSCAAGNAQFTQESPAGFGYGLWHGMISVISLIIHIFNENVTVYEMDNTGGWYDLGFLIGVICIWGGSSHVTYKSRKEKEREKEWDKICDKVEMKVMRKLKEWSADESDAANEKEWEEIGEKVEKKLKRKIREWAERD